MGNQNPAANEYDFKRAIDILYLAVSVISYFTSHLPIVKEAVVYMFVSYFDHDMNTDWELEILSFQINSQRKTISRCLANKARVTIEELSWSKLHFFPQQYCVSFLSISLQILTSDRRRRLHFSLIRELEIATVDDQKRQSVPLTLISFNLFGWITAYQQHMLNRNITGYEAPRNSPRGHLKRVPPNNDRGIDLWGLNSILWMEKPHPCPL